MYTCGANRTEEPIQIVMVVNYNSYKSYKFISQQMVRFQEMLEKIEIICQLGSIILWFI